MSRRTLIVVCRPRREQRPPEPEPSAR